MQPPGLSDESLSQWENWLKEAVYAAGRQEWRLAIQKLEKSYEAAQMAGSAELAWTSLTLLASVLEVSGYPVEAAQRNAQAQEVRQLLLGKKPDDPTRRSSSSRDSTRLRSVLLARFSRL